MNPAIPGHIIPSPSVPVCAVLSISNRLAQKYKNIHKTSQNPTKVHMYVMKTVIFRNQREFTVTVAQLPAGLVKPEPYRASCSVVTATSFAI